MIAFTPKRRIAAALVMAGLLLCSLWFFPVFFQKNYVWLISILIAGAAAAALKETDNKLVHGIALFLICVIFIHMAPNPLGRMKTSIACDWFDRCEEWQRREWLKRPAVPLQQPENDTSR
ncbi:MAG: hypothetical protein ACAH83_05265 [Alphaproteobacteria bacterium]